MTTAIGKKLREQGFDRTSYLPSSKSWRPRCSQCEVTVINGVACHEIGCPNFKKAKRRAA